MITLTPLPHDHGHVGIFSVGENVAKGQVANIGANNGFLPVGPGKGAVFSHESTLNKVNFYTLSHTVTPKSAQVVNFTGVCTLGLGNSIIPIA